MVKRTKKKKRPIDYIEQLELEIRNLKSINRHLTKKLKRVDRTFKEPKIEYDEDNSFKCQECFKGDIIETKIGSIRLIRRCSICDWREIKKI